MNFEEDPRERPPAAPPEREISLSTGSILGIFLALMLVCGAFFGFGYSMGHRAALAAAASIPETNTVAKMDKADSAFSNFKAPPAPVLKRNAPALADPGAPQDDAPPPDEAKANTAPAEVVSQPQVTADGTWMVQVSATTRKPDAEALTKILVGKGFSATIKPDQDQKFHVRVGPFASKKDADTTRKLLVASGYKDPFLTPR